MAKKSFYVIDLGRIIVVAQHDSRALCEEHIRNANQLFGAYTTHGAEVVEGSVALKQRLKELKAQ